ncbi:hypothetical protein [Pseudochryseolinea flava]|uniref:Uncharacterized protein n=1 Tax=Pseudochryseolinea flava TaxID=2059302 RepID=A0A364Y1X8_9BACT|nr:hypothetical protein [Pseudochryseolinea flava]RAV99785.1 hypothetical protein DQQ10_17220 [Pseudochryseolinea flava]
MKIKMLLSTVFSLSVLTVAAQENDDLYFNSKDRAKLAAEQASLTKTVAPVENATEVTDEESYSNPTDSYSSRDINPEFAARSNSEVASEDDANYYVSDYKFNNQTKFRNFNDNYSAWNNSPWYSSNYYGPQINRWNSPYYGYNNPYSSPWADPYWSYSGWSASFSYSYGNNYGYWNNPYCYNPYSHYYNPYGYYNYGGYPSYYDPYYGGGFGGYYGGGYYYPRTVVIINDGYRYTPNYGKRSSRSADVMREAPNRNAQYRTSRNPQRSSASDAGDVNGRTRTSPNLQTTSRPLMNTNNSNRQGEYYRRTWRANTTNSTGDDNNSAPARTNTNQPSRQSNFSRDNNTQQSSQPTRAREQQQSAPTRSSETWTPPSRSSSRSESSGGSTYTPPSRSSGSSSGGGGSSSGGGGSRGGRSRGN